MSGSDRSWADFPYTRIYHSLPERMGDGYDDPAFVGAYVKLLLPADAAHPLPVSLPRWLDDTMLGRLVAADLVRVVGTSNYTMAGLAKEREAQRSGRRLGGLARAAQAERDEQGRFGPASDQQPTSIDTQQPPASPAHAPAIQPAIDQLQDAGPPAPPATPPLPSPSHHNPPSGSISKAPKAGGRAREGSPTKKPNGPLLTAKQLAAWAGFGHEWGPFKAAWFAKGFRLPPRGTAEDDDTTQRGLLWSIAQERPNDLGRWVDEAPRGTTRGVIAHVLKRWHEVRDQGRIGLSDLPPAMLARSP